MSTFENTVTKQKPKKVEKLDDGRTGAELVTYMDGTRAVLKTQKDDFLEKPTQRLIPVETQPYREVAFYQLAKLFAFDDVVPETVLTTHDGKPASAQLYVTAMKLSQIEPELKKRKDMEHKDWVSLLRETCHISPKRQWLKLLILDLVAGQRDRHSQNVGIVIVLKEPRPEYNVLGWDNACTFGTTFSLYHNVFHKYLFDYAVNLEPHWDMLSSFKLEDFERVLGQYLNPIEVAHAYERLRFMLEYPYRLPWRVFARGEDRAPSYSPFFNAQPPTAIQNASVVAV